MDNDIEIIGAQLIAQGDRKAERLHFVVDGCPKGRRLYLRLGDVGDADFTAHLGREFFGKKGKEDRFKWRAQTVRDVFGAGQDGVAQPDTVCAQVADGNVGGLGVQVERKKLTLGHEAVAGGDMIDD